MQQTNPIFGYFQLLGDDFLERQNRIGVVHLDGEIAAGRRRDVEQDDGGISTGGTGTLGEEHHWGSRS